MDDHINPFEDCWEIPAKFRRKSTGRPKASQRRASQKFVLPKKRTKAQRKRRVYPSEAQTKFLREAGYTMKQIRQLSGRRAQELIDRQVPPHMANVKS